MYDFKYEHFESVYEFENTVNHRPVNPIFEGEESSFTGSEDFTGTANYGSANDMLLKGWNTQVERMEEELKSFSRTVKAVRTRQVKSVAGHAPCVPNAIRGVPKSMISVKRIDSKKNERTANLLFINVSNWATSSEDFMKAGMTVLKLAMLLDRAGVRSRVDVMPIATCRENSCYGCSVKVKDYRQTFNLSKLAYPIAHVSLFRRHGFRYLETIPGEMNRNMAIGHGQSKDKETAIMKAYLHDAVKADDAIVIDFNDCKSVDFDGRKLAERMGIKLEGA